MTIDVLDLVNAADVTLDDDEVLVLYATPVPRPKNGSSRTNPIPVDDYPLKPKRRIIDLSEERSYDEDVEIISSFPTKRTFLKGESSNTKPTIDVQDSTKPSTFICEICVDEKPRSERFRILGCFHAYCSECMSKYVASKIQENITRVNCPVLGCDGFLEPHHCRFILPKKVFDRWGDALCEAVILGSEKYYCPFKDCSALLIDDRRGEGDHEGLLQSECPYCNRLFCMECKVPWHVGIACSEFQKLNKDERSYEDIMLMNLAKKQRWQRCPMCRFYVQKSDGCLFMRCRCGHTFCYNCGAPMKEHYCQKCKR